MAVLKTENFEAGIAGATLSTVNTGAATVVVGTGNTQTFDGTFAVDPELLGLKVTLGTTNASLSEFAWTATASRVVVRIERFRFDLAASSWRPLCVRNSTPANAGNLVVDGATGLVSMVSNSATVTGSNSATVLAMDTDYDLEMAVTKGTTTSNGILEYRIYAFGSSTALETRVFTAVNTQTVDIAAVRLGSSNVASAAQTWWCDNLQVQSLASGWIGPTILPPVLSTVTVEDKAIIDARGSTAGAGGTLAYSITPTTGTSEPIEGVFLVPHGVTYTITVTETPSGLTDNTPTVVVAPAAAGNYSILIGNGTTYV